MSILEGMTKIYPDQSIFITVRDTTINFSKAAYELLGRPEGVEIFSGSGKIAVRGGSDFCFSKATPGKQNLYRICGKEMIRAVADQIGEGRVNGRFVANEKVLVFESAAE